MSADTGPFALMHYREFHAAEPLASHIECFWTIQPGGSRDFCAKRVFPDNCMDIYFIGAHPPMVAGPATTSYALGIPVGQAVFGLRLKPAAGAALLGSPAQLLRDQHVPLELVLPDVARRLAARVSCASSDRERRETLTDELVHVIDRGAPLDRVVAEATRLIARAPSEAVLKTTSLALEVGERQLRRRFLQAIGYGPKRFMRIVRFQRLLGLIRSNRADRDWPRLALDAGYADQAHMINDVQSIAGVSPGNLGL